MSRSRHFSHKLLLVLLLLALFCVPFMMAGVHDAPDSTTIQASTGILAGDMPAVQVESSTNYSAALGNTAGNNLDRAVSP